MGCWGGRRLPSSRGSRGAGRQLERPDCTAASRSCSIPFSYVVLSARLLGLALAALPAPTLPQLPLSGSDLGEEQPPLSPLGVTPCHPGTAPPPWLQHPLRSPALSPLQPRWPQRWAQPPTGGAAQQLLSPRTNGCGSARRAAQSGFSALDRDVSAACLVRSGPGELLASACHRLC